MTIWYSDSFTVPLCRSQPDRIFIFGDNLKRSGKGGQAIIRDEPNTLGIVTKVGPWRTESAYFSDKKSEINAMLSDLRKMWNVSRKSDIVFPTGGLGTGLAQMQYWSPKAYDKLCKVLFEHFGIINGGFDANQQAE